MWDQVFFLSPQGERRRKCRPAAGSIPTNRGGKKEKSFRRNHFERRNAPNSSGEERKGMRASLRSVFPLFATGNGKKKGGLRPNRLTEKKVVFKVPRKKEKERLQNNFKRQRPDENEKKKTTRPKITPASRQRGGRNPYHS